MTKSESKSKSELELKLKMESEKSELKRKNKRIKKNEGDEESVKMKSKEKKSKEEEKTKTKEKKSKEKEKEKNETKKREKKREKVMEKVMEGGGMRFKDIEKIAGNVANFKYRNAAGYAYREGGNWAKRGYNEANKLVKLGHKKVGNANRYISEQKREGLGLIKKVGNVTTSTLKKSAQYLITHFKDKINDTFRKLFTQIYLFLESQNEIVDVLFADLVRTHKIEDIQEFESIFYIIKTIIECALTLVIFYACLILFIGIKHIYDLEMPELKQDAIQTLSQRIRTEIHNNQNSNIQRNIETKMQVIHIIGFIFPEFLSQTGGNGKEQGNRQPNASNNGNNNNSFHNAVSKTSQSNSQSSPNNNSRSSFNNTILNIESQIEKQIPLVREIQYCHRIINDKLNELRKALKDLLIKSKNKFSIYQVIINIVKAQMSAFYDLWYKRFLFLKSTTKLLNKEKYDLENDILMKQKSYIDTFRQKTNIDRIDEIELEEKRDETIQFLQNTLQKYTKTKKMAQVFRLSDKLDNVEKEMLKTEIEKLEGLRNTEHQILLLSDNVQKMIKLTNKGISSNTTSTINTGTNPITNTGTHTGTNTGTNALVDAHQSNIKINQKVSLCH